jgi:hypothetical protein
MWFSTLSYYHTRTMQPLNFIPDTLHYTTAAVLDPELWLGHAYMFTFTACSMFTAYLFTYLTTVDWPTVRPQNMLSTIIVYVSGHLPQPCWLTHWPLNVYCLFVYLAHNCWLTYCPPTVHAVYHYCVRLSSLTSSLLTDLLTAQCLPSAACLLSPLEPTSLTQLKSLHNQYLLHLYCALNGDYPYLFSRTISTSPLFLIYYNHFILP